MLRWVSNPGKLLSMEWSCLRWAAGTAGRTDHPPRPRWAPGRPAPRWGCSRPAGCSAGSRGSGCCLPGTARCGGCPPAGPASWSGGIRGDWGQAKKVKWFYITAPNRSEQNLQCQAQNPETCIFLSLAQSKNLICPHFQLMHYLSIFYTTRYIHRGKRTHWCLTSIRLPRHP